MITVEFRGVGMNYGNNGASLVALQDVSFHVAEREFVCILGPSGCGKSTALHLAAGLLRPSAGEVLINDGGMPGPRSGMVFQQHNLFPWETVRGNVEFGLRMRGVSQAVRAEISERYLRKVRLWEFADNYPRQLSLGMQQRVGLARAFADDPDILLMDEPFASLDALTRLQMQELLIDVWVEHRKTVLFVTHDVEEALRLGDRLIVLSARPGRVIREWPVDFERPRDRALLGDPRLNSMKGRVLKDLMAE